MYLTSQQPPDEGGFHIKEDTKDTQDAYDKTATFINQKF